MVKRASVVVEAKGKNVMLCRSVIMSFQITYKMNLKSQIEEQ